MSKINRKILAHIRFFEKGSLLLLLCLFMAGCASSSKVAKSSEKAKGSPDWVTGPSAAYPKAEYLTGRGFSSDKKSAGIDAINELVSVFGQSLSSASMASQRMIMAQKDGLVATSESASLGQDILREVNQNDVIAVEIPEFFESKSEGKW